MDMVALFCHDVFYIHFLISKPAQIVCNEMEIVTTLTSYEYYSILVSIFTKGPPLFSLTNLAGVHHE